MTHITSKGAACAAPRPRGRKKRWAEMTWPERRALAAAEYAAYKAKLAADMEADPKLAAAINLARSNNSEVVL